MKGKCCDNCAFNKDGNVPFSCLEWRCTNHLALKKWAMRALEMLLKIGDTFPINNRDYKELCREGCQIFPMRKIE
jgi:hypothetical protein